MNTPPDPSPPAPVTAGSYESLLGATIRRLRTRRRKTVREIAEAAGISAAMVSKVETGQVNPSISTIVQIAQALEVPTAYLFAHESEDASTSVKVNDKRSYTYNGVRFTAVVPSPNGVRLIVVEADPGAERGTPLYPHSPHDGHEQGIILAGQMELTIAGVVHLLRAGDTISFPSRLPHSWRNPGDEILRATWAIYYPTDS